MKNEKISPHQFLVLVTLFSIGTTILVVPSGLAAEAKQDAWIVAIVGTGMGVFVVWIFTTIARGFPNMTLIQINEKLFGKWLGKTVSLLFVSMPFLYTAFLLLYNGEFLTTHVIPDTPVIVINISMAIILLMGVRLGLETLARSAEILIVAFFVLFIFLVVSFFLPPIQLKIENIQPVFDVDTKTILRASLNLVVTSSINSVILLMIFPSVINQLTEGRKSFFIGNFIGGLVIIIITFLSVLVLGADITSRQMYSGYTLARKINIGNFIQRVDGIMAIMWVIAIYFKMALYFYAAVLGIAQILNVKEYRPLTFPLGMIVVVLSVVIFPNIIARQHWDLTTLLAYSLSIGLFLPLIMMVMSTFRKKKRKNGNENS